MATITEKSKGNKVVSFRFYCCVGRNEQEKEYFRTTTWKPIEEMSDAKAAGWQRHTDGYKASEE